MDIPPGFYILRWPGAAISNRIYWPIVLRALADSIEAGDPLVGHHIAKVETSGATVEADYFVKYDLADIDLPEAPTTNPSSDGTPSDEADRLEGEAE